MGIGRGVHPRSPQRFFSEKEASGVGSSPDDRVRRAPPLSRRRRSAEILRFHVPQVPPVPYQDGSLTLAVTHKFPRGGGLIEEYQSWKRGDLPLTRAMIRSARNLELAELRALLRYVNPVSEEAP